jgi:Ca2+-binding EF-hand superfamily protein
MPGVLKITSVILSLFVATAAFAVNDRAEAQSKGHGRQMMHKMDTDRNGRVSKAEYMRYMEGQFNRLDTNRNGSISAREMSRFCSTSGDINDPIRICE